MAVGDAYVFPGFLTPVLTQLFFPKPLTTFLTCFCRGERRKFTRPLRGTNFTISDSIERGSPVETEIVRSFVFIHSTGKLNYVIVSSLPDDKTLDQSRFKAFAGDRIIVSQEFCLETCKKNSCLKLKKNAYVQHFLSFPKSFQ